jgi:hypothetical protein
MNIPGWGNQLLDTLPSKYRPSRTVRTVSRVRNSGTSEINDVWFEINANGELNVTNFASGNTVTGTQNGFIISYITSASDS